MTRSEVDKLTRGDKVTFKFGPHPVNGIVDMIYEEKSEIIVEIEYLCDGAPKSVKRNRKLVVLKS